MIEFEQVIKQAGRNSRRIIIPYELAAQYNFAIGDKVWVKIYKRKPKKPRRPQIILDNRPKRPAMPNELLLGKRSIVIGEVEE